MEKYALNTDFNPSYKAGQTVYAICIEGRPAPVIYEHIPFSHIYTEQLDAIKLAMEWNKGVRGSMQRLSPFTVVPAVVQRLRSVVNLQNLLGKQNEIRI